MADFSTLIASIEATIKQNGVQAITGQVLQDELLLMVSAINQLKQDTLEGYSFYGEPLPNGATRVVTQNTFFLAGAGSYTINGNAVTITDSGISVIVYDCVNDEITTYQLFAYDANPTSGSTNAVTSGGVKSALDTKADKNGASPDLFAGFAGNLVDTRSAGTRQGPFAFRQSGGDGVNYMRKILGRTEAWNQVFQVLNIRNFSGDFGTYTIINNNTDTYITFPCVPGHSYLLACTAVIPSGAAASFGFPAANKHTQGLVSGRNYWIATSEDTENITISVFDDVINSASAGITLKDFLLIDLTLMYGAGNEPITADQFRALHPLPYYNYNAGVLKNNAATGLETTGFNQWNEEWENGYYTGSEGEALNKASHQNFISCANLIKVMPSTAYNLHFGSVGGGYMVKEVDENRVVIKNTTASLNDLILTTNSRTRFIVWYIRQQTTYNHDICINLSDASRNGTYEPYWKREIVLGLNNLPCHDENNNAVVVNGLDGVGTSQDELIVENGWGTKIIKRRGRRAYQAGDESDATLMTDGTNTDYPLATPKVLTLDNPIPALIEVDNLGTEKRLPEDTADNPQGPFECDSNYSVSTANLVRKLSE